MSFVFILGGAKSGKSSAAVKYAMSYQSKNTASVYFIATATPGDEEMSEKIRRHKSERPTGFITIEEQIDLPTVISDIRQGFVIVDCMTLWIFNLLQRGYDHDSLVLMVKELGLEMTKGRVDGIVISNDVGSGIVPADAYSRRYRDELGTANQILAGYAEKSYLMLAGKQLLLSDGDSL